MKIRIKKTFILIATVLFWNLNTYGNPSKCKQKITLIEYQQLEDQKSLIENGDKDAIDKYNQLLEEAELVLKHRNFSVVNKSGVPPSGDKHDYMTIGPYWWPNPETKDGLPYIRKDGEINPETRNNFTDFKEAEAFFKAIRTLRDAYYFTENKKYAQKAIFFIKAWFLDDSTRMNPNINFGQSVPGKVDGRGFAIIEFEKIIEVIKCMELLKDHNLPDCKTEQQMNEWFTEYAYWLQNSKNGVQEANTKNNHGTHYDVQLLSILTYLGKVDEVKEYLTTVTKNRIFSQIEPDGSQPLELARTKSFSYSVMNLNGFLKLAGLAQKLGIDLWNAETEDGRSIKKGFEYLFPYLTQERKWEYKQITDVNHSMEKLISAIKYAHYTFKDNTFDNFLRQIENKKVCILFE